MNYVLTHKPEIRDQKSEISQSQKQIRNFQFAFRISKFLSQMPFQMPTEQVKQRKQKYPDDVHKVPVESGNLDRRVILRPEAPAPRHDRHHGQQSDADDHVQRVHAGHGEIDPVEQLDIMDRSAGNQMQL